jgi:hypothetical protein
VDAADHVGPVQHERLVALAVEATVVLPGQVELLERGSHPAVVDDDPRAHRVHEVARRHRGIKAIRVARIGADGPSYSSFVPTRPEAGLCDSCRHQQLVRTTRGSEFSLCRRSRDDPSFPRYPRVPVTQCRGYERGASDNPRTPG